jgi:hypothetical protein
MDKKPVRRWQDIATELMNEFDPKQVLKLSAELDEALAKELAKPLPERQGEIASVPLSAIPATLPRAHR